jgi:hypothetical protein
MEEYKKNIRQLRLAHKPKDGRLVTDCHQVALSSLSSATENTCQPPQEHPTGTPPRSPTIKDLMSAFKNDLAVDPMGNKANQDMAILTRYQIANRSIRGIAR